MPCVDSTLGMLKTNSGEGLKANTNSYFYKHELLEKYEWYWRLEPEIKYFCDIT